MQAGQVKGPEKQPLLKRRGACPRVSDGPRHGGFLPRLGSGAEAARIRSGLLETRAPPRARATSHQHFFFNRFNLFDLLIRPTQALRSRCCPFLDKKTLFAPRNTNNNTRVRSPPRPPPRREKTSYTHSGTPVAARAAHPFPPATGRCRREPPIGNASPLSVVGAKLTRRLRPRPRARFPPPVISLAHLRGLTQGTQGG